MPITSVYFPSDYSPSDSDQPRPRTPPPRRKPVPPLPKRNAEELATLRRSIAVVLAEHRESVLLRRERVLILTLKWIYRRESSLGLFNTIESVTNHSKEP